MSARLLSQLGALGLAVILAAGCAGTAAEKAAQATPAAQPGADLGIRVESLRLTAADYMLDFRFRIVDPALAEPFFNRKIEIQMVDPATGAQLGVPNTPKLGKLRQVARRDMLDRTYYMLFANPGQYIRPGARLTLVIGDTRLENILVEGGGDRHEPATHL